MQTGEVEGTAFIQSASGARPLAGITIQAIDGDGVVIAQARSSYDGFFILSRLPLGQYRLEVALEDIKRLGLKAPAIPSINIGQAGDIASAGDLYVGKLTSHWTAPSIEPKAVQASQAPTNEFDETS